MLIDFKVTIWVKKQNSGEEKRKRNFGFCFFLNIVFVSVYHLFIMPIVMFIFSFFFRTSFTAVIKDDVFITG